VKYVPPGWKAPPTVPAIYNGAPTYASHVRDLDRYATWLAAGYRHHHPWIPGNWYASGKRYEIVVRVPQFCAHVGFEFLATGRGAVTVSNDHDAWTAATDVFVGGGGAGTHDVEDAQLVSVTTPQAGVAADGALRALDVELAKQPAWYYFDFALTDYGGGSTLRLYGWRPVYVPLLEDTDLSSAA